MSASLSSVAAAPTLLAASGGCGADMGTRQVVVLVHGFNSDITTWTKAKPAMLAAVSGADPGNVYVRLFDYGSKSTQWVTDPAIGPALASFVRCLVQASTTAGGSGKVILVGHSMGGLAIQCALDPGCTPNPVEPGKVGLVVTIGTPNAGSQIRPGPAADSVSRLAG
jgi:pimeloyl-ACP methyl ester carboxylesterase